MGFIDMDALMAIAKSFPNDMAPARTCSALHRHPPGNLDDDSACHWVV